MSYTKGITIWCNECCKWKREDSIKLKDFRTKLRAIGWIYNKKLNKDLCPSCKNKGKI